MELRISNVHVLLAERTDKQICMLMVLQFTVRAGSTNGFPILATILCTSYVASSYFKDDVDCRNRGMYFLKLYLAERIHACSKSILNLVASIPAFPISRRGTV